MRTKIVEVTQASDDVARNWGKFLVGRPDVEWTRRSVIAPELGVPLLRQRGWRPEHVWVMDLETGEGAFFRHGGDAHADLEQHRIWVCPLFEPFLAWLYKQNFADVEQLPDLVELDPALAPFAMQGHRRRGDPREHEIARAERLREALSSLIGALERGEERYRTALFELLAVLKVKGVLPDFCIEGVEVSFRGESEALLDVLRRARFALEAP
jgi:hypothetical protein